MLEILPQDDELAPGQMVLRRYRLDRIVGEGGMGVVWAATNVLTEKPCALKFLKGSRATDPRSQARLFQEARAACRVRHPNVAAVHDILELPSGAPFIVMDLLEGEPLAALLARAGAIDVDATLDIMIAVLGAIRAAHALGVVHRDLKPDNVFLERGVHGTVKVLDFGIAKRFDTAAVAAEAPAGVARDGPPSGDGLMTTYSAIGTPSYMAPEQLQGEAQGAGIAVDVWALGLLAYECLTGVLPLRDPRTGRVVSSTAREELTRADRAVPASIVDAVLRMTELVPADRPTLADVDRTFLAVRAARRSEVEAPRAPRRRRVGAREVSVLLAVLSGAAILAVAMRPTREGVPTRADPTTPAPSSSAPPPPSASAAPEAPLIPSAAPTAIDTAPRPSASVPPSGRKRADVVPSASTATRSAPAVPASTSAAAPTSSYAIPSYERK